MRDRARSTHTKQAHLAVIGAHRARRALPVLLREQRLLIHKLSVAVIRADHPCGGSLHICAALTAALAQRKGRASLQGKRQSTCRAHRARGSLASRTSHVGLRPTLHPWPSTSTPTQPASTRAAFTDARCVSSCGLLHERVSGEEAKQTSAEGEAPSPQNQRWRTRGPLSRTSLPSGPSRRSSAARNAASLRCGVVGMRQSAWGATTGAVSVHALHAPVLLSCEGNNHSGGARAQGGTGRAEGCHHVCVACRQAVRLVRRKAARQAVCHALLRARQKGATCRAPLSWPWQPPGRAGWRQSPTGPP